MTNFCTKNDYVLCEDRFAKQDMVAFKWPLIFSRRLPRLWPTAQIAISRPHVCSLRWASVALKEHKGDQFD